MSRRRAGCTCPIRPQGHAELRELAEENQARLRPFELDEDLEKLREREWLVYGERLKDHVVAVAAALPGLSVPVEVTEDPGILP